MSLGHVEEKVGTPPPVFLSKECGIAWKGRSWVFFGAKECARIWKERTWIQTRL